MIALDTNLLVYAHRRDDPQHVPAVGAVRDLLESAQPVAIPAPCLGEFVSVVTSARMSPRPSTIQQAIEQVDVWLSPPWVQLIGERSEHWDRLRGLLDRPGVTGARVHDARIAAICLDHGVRELWTADRDFGRFPELRTRNPLVAAAG